nr:imidazole glycerol phosphate synthase subunit HisH [Ereboglobus luteus]
MNNAQTNTAATHIAVIDNGICNLRSVTKALETVGATTHIIRAPDELPASATGLVLPGVGALRDCVASLQTTGLADTVRAWIAADRPFLGVCLGMQALFEYSEEGDTRGLGILPGKVVRFERPPEYKIPHMGWNTVRFTQPASPLAADLKPGASRFISCTATTASPQIPRSSSPPAITAASSRRPSRAATATPRNSIPKKARRAACNFTATL